MNICANQHNIRLISLLTTFGMFVFVFSSWCQQPSAGIPSEILSRHSSKAYCTGVTTKTTYLAEIRTRFSGLGKSGLVSPILTTDSYQQPTAFISSNYTSVFAAQTCPLWLLHRSFLI
ncbi:MAG: hypothetical protein K8F91_17415 [Candidatus Obscuribacterales bacterium]|nr:hypothetical protein [Candidatus Obscuribacterales bacterium]